MNEILSNGKGGDMFPVNDFKELSKKITLFFKNPTNLNKKLIIARRNIKKYSISEHVKKYEKVFYEV